MKLARLAPWLVVVLLSLPGALYAQEGYTPLFPEYGLGATNLETTTGNGGLSVGLSRDGDVTVLSWPSPSYYDHLHYMSMNGEDARSKPRFGATKRMGAFAALAVQESGSAGTSVHVLRDWDRDHHYLDYDNSVVVTEFTNSTLGLTVEQFDFVMPSHDVFVRRYVVTRDASSDVQKAWLMSYHNLSPTLSQVPQVPLMDIFDYKNDFLAVWNDNREAIIHFHPDDTGVFTEIFDALSDPNRNFGAARTLLRSDPPKRADVEGLARNLDSEYSSGVYISVGSTPSPASFQVGEDATDTCAQVDQLVNNATDLDDKYPEYDTFVDPSLANRVKCDDFDPVQDPRDANKWSYTAKDAYDDMMDGELEESRIAAAQVNGALKVPLSFSGDTAEAATHFAFGETAADANSELQWARGRGPTTLQQSAVAEHEQFVDDIFIPEEVSGDLKRFIQRTFLNLRIGTDRETGAVVSSLSRQPSYQLDWPRDAVFFNVAKDISGIHDIVTTRMIEFYANNMRMNPTKPVPLLNRDAPGWPGKPDETYYPPNTWEMNYYANGIPGGTIRLEIDNTALIVIAYIQHARYLEGSEREQYLDDAWPTIQKATNWLHSWRDPETGLNWPANEDDHTEYTQGLQGAETTYGALVAAARLAKKRGRGELADDWLHRAGELKNATLHHMYVEGKGFTGFPDQKFQEGKLAGSPAWLAWPTHMLPYDDPRLQDQLKREIDFQMPRVRGETKGGQYPTKVSLSAALALPDGEYRDKALEIAKRVAGDIANDETYAIGEAWKSVDEDGDGKADKFINGVSTPHLWSSVLVYLTAVAYHNPEKFDPNEGFLPSVEVPDVTPPGVDAAEGADTALDSFPPDASGDTGGSGERGGCQCDQGGAVPLSGAVLGLLGLVGLLGLRRLRFR